MKTVRSPWAYMRWHARGEGSQRPILETLLNFFPIRMTHQALFTEACSQALVSGMEVDSAIESAALTSKCLRFRHAMQKVASCFRTGDSLTDGLSKTGVWTSKLFRASLNVGENRGYLAGELAAFARNYSPTIADRLARSVGRSAEVTRFIMALSRLLINHRMTVEIIKDAAIVAAGKGSQFERTIEAVVEHMRDGEPLSRAMQLQSQTFDQFLCRLVAAAAGRDVLRQTLMRACGSVPGHVDDRYVPTIQSTR